MSPTAARPTLRVAIADDAALFRRGLALLLAEAGFAVTAQVGDAAGAARRGARRPAGRRRDDIRMPPTHTTEGLDAARALAEEPPGGRRPRALGARRAAVRAAARRVRRARGGLPAQGAGGDLDELADAVRRVAAGGLVVDPSVVAGWSGAAGPANPLDDLTEREREVLAVMAEGRSNQAICQRLYLSPKTVEAYVRSVFTKLGLHPGADDNRRVLAVLAFLRG